MTLRKLQRNHLSRAGPRPDEVVPALQVGPRLALDRQVKPAMRGAPVDDVGRREAVVGEVLVLREVGVEDAREALAFRA